jgi:hypothetical protein
VQCEDCPVCVHLLTAHEALQRAYYTAFDAMLEASGGPVEEFMKRRASQGEAWIEVETARLEFEWHQRSHT